MSLRFGFGHVPAEHYAKHVELVQLAERLGFDSAWLADQTFYRDPYVVLAAIALATERIDLGIGVTNPYTRHPAMAARAIATLADIAPGRITLGIGAGNVKELLHPLALEDRPVAARCREMVELVRAALTAEPVDYVGPHYQMAGARLEIDAGAGVPIYVAGRGQRVLASAGAVADGVLIGGLCDEPGIEYALDRVARGAHSRARDPRTLAVCSWVTVFLTDDRERAIRDTAPMVAHIIGGAPDHVLEAIGLDEGEWRAIKSTYHREGIPEAAALVTEASTDAFAIVGDAELCVERIRALERAGVTEFIFLLPKNATVDEQRVHLERFADGVLSAFRVPAC
jgi:5,10-methylenetetrahydromethanopterin reductase